MTESFNSLENIIKPEEKNKSVSKDFSNKRTSIILQLFTKRKFLLLVALGLFLIFIFFLVIFLIFNQKTLKLSILQMQIKSLFIQEKLEKNVQQTKYDKVEIAQIAPLSKTVFTVRLKTDKGEKQIFRRVIELMGTVQSIDSTQSEFLNWLSILPDSIIFLRDNSLGFYDKSTKTVNSANLPEDIFKERDKFSEIKNNAEEKESIEFKSEELNSVIVLLRFFRGYVKHGVYLLNKKDLSLSKIQQFENSCTSVYCTGPWLIKKLSEDEFIFQQGGGDACWRAGVIHKYNLESKSLLKLLDYTSGCYTEKDDFIGVLGDNIISAKHAWVKDTTNNFGSSTLYQEIYKMDPNGNKTTLISQTSIPSEIKRLWVIEDTNSIYLSNEKDKYYLYDFQTDTVKEINKEKVITPTPYPEKKPDVILKDNSVYLKADLKKVGINKVTNAKTWNTGLSIIDDEKDEIEALPISFLEGKFDAERTDSRFKDKLNVYKFTDLSYARVLNNDEVIFNGNLRYSTLEGLKLIESKTFILNIKTGKIYLVKSLGVN